MNYTYSRLSSDSISQLIQSNYNLPTIISCHYYVFGLHDNYLIECNTIKFIFRVYRNSWRTKSEIYFELELLTYLKNKESPIASPVLRKDGKLSTAIECPEGTRITALFTYADGYPLLVDEISVHECQILGRSVAQLHEDMHDFKTKHIRPIFDFQFLVERSLNLIKPFLTNKHYLYLIEIQSIIKNNISCLNITSENYGICVGDINLTNFHINANQAITHFDFDQCGYGFRAFEVGKFFSSIHHLKNKEDCMQHFLLGYETVRTLSKNEKKTIRYFEIAAILWVMSIHVNNIDKIGYQYLESSYWNKRLKIIEQLEQGLTELQ